MQPASHPDGSSFRAYRAAVRFFRPDAARVAGAVALLALNTALALLKPWPLAWLVDRLSGSTDGWTARWSGSPASLVAVLSALLVAVHGAHALLGACQQAVVISTGLRGLARVRQAVFERLLALSFRRWHGSEAGDLIYRATWDTYSFQTLFTQGLFTVLGAGVAVLAMTVVMSRVNGTLTLVALATVPVLLLVMRLMGPGLGRRSAAAQAADASVAGGVQQAVANLALIQGYTQEPQETARFGTAVQTALRARWNQHRHEVLYLALVAVVLAAGTGAIAWVGGLQVVSGRLTTGGLIVFIAYLVQLYEPLNQLSHVGSTVSQARAGAERVLDLLEPEGPAGRSAAATESAAVPSGPLGIEFDRVSFGYRDGQRVLRDVSFRVEPGEVVALVGPSGAGKSTLLQLLPRFFEPDAGTIRLGGRDLRELGVRDLRRHIGFVLQESLLLPGTIAENIGLGREGATRAEIESAARAANADGFIRNLPDGYDTRVGDGAARLSVGEKQRVSIARAFLKDAPVLLLDEPTSALDAASEEAVLSAIHALMRDRTVILVAHRPESLRGVHRVLRLEHGSVVTGSPS